VEPESVDGEWLTCNNQRIKKNGDGEVAVAAAAAAAKANNNRDIRSVCTCVRYQKWLRLPFLFCKLS